MSCRDATIVIPQRGRSELTIQCVKSLRQFEGELSPVIVVDDGSGDDSVEQVRCAGLTNCRVLEQASLGVTAAWNHGLQNVETALVVLLNNDVIVTGWFTARLLEPLRKRGAVISGVDWRFDSLAHRLLNRRLQERRILAGWCMAFRVDLWQELRGFDEVMERYFSDTDFQCRAVHAHPRCGLVAVQGHERLPIRHLEHQTAARCLDRQRQWRKDQRAFKLKHGIATTH